ncbi:MAG: hypothetical protein K2G16_10035, partial [Lachnospiraceae bacterium]|nr:hypothetical protein [Lachnospiraceae bacterium]
MVKHKRIKRITAGLLAGILILMLAACGKGEGNSKNNIASGGTDSTGGTQNAGGKEDDGDYVYIPAFYNLPVDKDANYTSYSNITFAGDRMYYTYAAYKNDGNCSEWCYIDTANPEAGPVVLLDLAEYEVWGETSAVNVAGATVCADGGTLLLLKTTPLIPMDATEEEYARQQRETVYNIKKIAADGT